ncbi:MAG TPA: arsenate reductase ArsC [Candidatus Paceibacterota bacterium]|nr:arsenate reductase ArsC [Candidatus Paceibacterota bacterium]
MKRVLFFCVHNSARSQMAEAWLKQIGGNDYEVESAGLEPGTVKRAVIEVMREVDIDMSKNQTQSVFDIFNSGRTFDYVIALCDESNAKRCPVFPGAAKLLLWDFPERPKQQQVGTKQLAHYRIVRGLIKDRVTNWIAEKP